MRIVKLIRQGGHPYWNRNNFRVIRPDGSGVGYQDQLDLYPDIPHYKSGENSYCAMYNFEIYVEPSGIYCRPYHCGSGYGKQPAASARLLIAASCFDYYEIHGNIMPISTEMADEIATIENSKKK